jgi:hypothetical protein
MENFLKLFFFYSAPEIISKDVETEIFTDNREKIDFFLFHNKDLHFSKSEILKKCLFKMFETVEPEFENAYGNLIMSKVIQQFNNENFDKIVDFEFEDYTKKINYRIECIIQTINLFLDLYKDRKISFVLPAEIIAQIENTLKERNTIYEVLLINDPEVKDWDIPSRINYYSRKENISSDKYKIGSENIKKILKVI